MSPSATARVDRAAAVRAALRLLVARNGFHGASMSAVAAEAGVATGTAYVHYESKEALVLDTYLEVKRELGAAAVADVEASASPERRFRSMWYGVYRHLSAEPERARFLVQVDSSPYASSAHDMAMGEKNDPLVGEAAKPDMVARLAHLPIEVLYDLGIGPAVRLTASGTTLTDEALLEVSRSCWRAITRSAKPAALEAPSRLRAKRRTRSNRSAR